MNGHGTTEGHLTEVVYGLMEGQYRADDAETVKLFSLVNVYSYRDEFAKTAGIPAGRHADWMEFLHLYKVLGKEYFNGERMSRLKDLQDKGGFDGWKKGVLGMPSVYRSKQGVLGQPLPNSNDYEGLADKMWEFFLGRIESEIKSKIDIFIKNFRDKKALQDRKTDGEFSK
jgi:hypothetical protein